MYVDLENFRTMDEYREQIDQEQENLAAAGFTPRERQIWLAGARWATRIARGMAK